jgi:hypothetical protein
MEMKMSDLIEAAEQLDKSGDRLIGDPTSEKCVHEAYNFYRSAFNLYQMEHEDGEQDCDCKMRTMLTKLALIDVLYGQNADAKDLLLRVINLTFPYYNQKEWFEAAENLKHMTIQKSEKKPEQEDE